MLCFFAVHFLVIAAVKPSQKSVLHATYSYFKTNMFKAGVHGGAAGRGCRRSSQLCNSPMLYKIDVIWALNNECVYDSKLNHCVFALNFNIKLCVPYVLYIQRLTDNRRRILIIEKGKPHLSLNNGKSGMIE